MKAYIQKRRDEKGASDVVVVLFMLPIVVWILLSLIDISMYFQARTMVQNTARDAAREVAIWGGNNSPLTPTGKSVEASATSKLWDGSKCTPGACKSKPAVKCTPNRTTAAGQEVSCTITYSYSSLAPGNPITGFGKITGGSFTITEYARSETGFR